jgi:hypothetical protein
LAFGCAAFFGGLWMNRSGATIRGPHWWGALRDRGLSR